MQPEHVLTAVLDSGTLPTLSTVASKLVSISSREETTMADIASLVAMDISLSTKVLKVVNSAFYNFPQQVSTIQQAVSILGTNAVRSLVLSFSFLSIEATNRKDTFHYRKFWEKSLAAGVSARLIMEKLKQKELEEGFIAGLLQNVGELILARAFPNEYGQVLLQSEENDNSRMALERDLIGADHCHIGAEVFKHWGFPEILWVPLCYHHDPRAFTGKDNKQQLFCKVVFLSGLLSDIFYSKKPQDLIKSFRLRAKALVHLSEKDVDDIYERVHIEVEKAASYFGLEIDNTKSIAEILQRANVELSVLNLSYEQVNRELVEAKIGLENLAKELEEKNRVLQQLVNIDGLTEVYNHRYFQEILSKELSRAVRNERPLCLILADIDHFKKFNDTFGHQVGDHILKQFCQVVKDDLREHDLLARYGGEEFALILPETDLEQGMLVADRIRAKVAEHSFEDEDQSYRVTVSMGISALQPGGEAIKKSQLIGEADEALLSAKKKGRNQVAEFTAKKKWFKRT